MATVPARTAPADLIGYGLVLVGPFDPMALQPAKLADSGLLDPNDLEALSYDILSNEITVLKLPWMQLVVETNKLTAVSTLESPLGEPVRDFVLGWHEERPVKLLSAVGLNYDTHFAISSEEAWHKVGNLLTPKETFWDKYLYKSGMLSITIRSQRRDERPGHFNVKVEPSTRIHPGVYVNLNVHLASSDGGLSEPDKLIGAINEEWNTAKRLSDEIVVAMKGLV